MHKVDVSEDVSILVGTWLLNQGFVLANARGRAIDSLSSDTNLVILSKDPAYIPKPRLFGLIRDKARRAYLGTIWFSDASRNAHESHWIFEVLGRSYLEEMSKLAEELSTQFDVKISVKLIQENTELETFLSDDAD